MAQVKTYIASLQQWPNGSYGLVAVLEGFENPPLDPIAQWEVRVTSRDKVATQIIASLLGHDTTHAVWRRS